MYGQHGAFSMRSQMFPNAVNHQEFGLKTILNPGKIYYHEVIYKFGTFSQKDREPTIGWFCKQQMRKEARGNEELDYQN